MKTKIDIRKLLQSTKRPDRKNGSFDKALIGLGISILNLPERK